MTETVLEACLGLFGRCQYRPKVKRVDSFQQVRRDGAVVLGAVPPQFIDGHVHARAVHQKQTTASLGKLVSVSAASHDSQLGSTI